MFRTLPQALAPFLEHPLESVIDDGVQLVLVGLDKCQVQHRNLAVSRGGIVLFLPLALVGGRVGVAVSHQPLGALDVLEGLPEIVLPADPLVPFLLDELQRAQAQTAVLVRLAEEPDGLALATETADGLLVGNVEGDVGVLAGGAVASSAEKAPSGAGESVEWLALGREGVKDTERVASVFLDCNACAFSAVLAASSRAFRSSSSFIRSMSPLRMYLLGRDGAFSRALRLEAISALRASMGWAKKAYLSKVVLTPFYSDSVLQHHHNVRRRHRSEQIRSSDRWV